MMRVRFLSLLLLGFLLTISGLFLNGCGSAGGTMSSPTASVGRARLTIRWPSRTDTRLIPFAANSIHVRLTNADGSRLFGDSLLVRPADGGPAAVSFERLPIGPLTVTATAYPGNDGSGVGQATAQTTTDIVANQIAEFRLTLASTIDHLEVSPTTASVTTGETVQITATAKSAAGEVVLTDSSTFTYTSDNTAVATVAPGGLVTATGAGTTNITVTETESGKTGTVAVTVTTTNPPPTGTLYVSSFYTHNIQRYDSTSGTFQGSFIPTRSGGLHLPHEILFGPNNIVYVRTDDSGIRRYNADTGAYLDTFISASSGGLFNACGMVLNKDGSLLVCSAWTNEIKRYDGQTGTYLGNFISGNGLVLPHDIILGPDNRLYVCSNRTGEVKRYDADTGAFLGNFVTAGSGGLNEPSGLVFGPDGNLYVTSFATHEIKRYNGQTGAFLNNFVTAQSGGLSNPVGLAFGPDGHLYVVSKATNRVKRYHGQTGAYLGDLDPSNAAGLDQPWGITFR